VLTAGQRTAWELLAAVVLCAAVVGGFAAHERQVGALTVAVADDVTVVKHWQAVADTAAGRLRVDTLRLVQRLNHTDTALVLRIDTAVVHHVDSVFVPVQVLVQADSAIRSCRVTVSDCEAYGAAQKARGDALTAELGKVKALQPSPLLPHLGLGVAAGINTQSKFDAVAGLTVSWKIP
jgi:hypothetical protein